MYPFTKAVKRGSVKTAAVQSSPLGARAHTLSVLSATRATCLAW
jgi:hypothetical protein